ncbi:alpha/beta hydrolase fold domain-containing protein [Nitratireductor sp. CAU 1489]|uniref:Alpha/beta hydrolase fold domain-containing protein n=1 Tax=Nitratireductor arenosus TaxID=2682096 RepID=A0A844QDC2_9HYPH|nr:alpha/beta hydrolase [Nitratireductor arenosus]MVA97262.1 alpha/beta hydrolase fold domain-containing protein [Nitratireductor arenosus]
MQSLKSRLVALVLKYTRKKSFRSAAALHKRIAAARKVEDYRPPQTIGRRLDIKQRQVEGFPVYEVALPTLRSERRLIYFHGGAYCFEITPFHWNLIAELAERLAISITVPIYPLAPEHDIHAMFAMATTLYRQMVAQTPAGDILLAGDSAGGNMAVVLTMMAAREGLPLPAAHLLISPGLDMTMTNPQVEAAARRDPWLDIPGGLEAVRLYSAGIDVADWRVSPLYGDLSVLPPSLVFSGTSDLLYPDTLVFVEKARRAGVEIELVTGEKMFHVWPLIDMPEAREARERMVAFLSERLAAPPAPPVRTAPSS